jgi:hypothetical protein
MKAKPLRLSINTLKNDGQRVKNVFSRGRYQWEGGVIRKG